MQRNITYILFILLLLSSPGLSQQKDLNNIDWLSFGVGPGENEQISSYINYTFLDESAFQLTFNSSMELKLFGKSKHNLYSASLSYGLTDIGDWFFGGVFMGPSFMLEERPNQNNSYSAGINLNAQYFFAFADVNGIGLDAFVNVNTLKTIYGVRVSLFFKSIK